MPIQYITVGKRNCPVAVCDACSKTVDNSEDGNALWITVKRGGKWIHEPRIYITHKRCNHAYQNWLEASSEGHVLSEGLDVCIAMLVKNLGVTFQSAKRTKHRVDLLDSIE